MNHRDLRPWLVYVFALAATAFACSPSTGGSADGHGGGRNQRDGGASDDEPGDDDESPDGSVKWDSGFPDDEDEPDPGCTPKTCTQLGANCGAIDNGCGKLIDCGSCPEGKTCGAGEPNVCGTGACKAKTCGELGAECGMQGDGCSAVLDCGACTLPEFCGGGGPSKCGRGVSCDNLCKQQVTCPGTGTTTLKGTVYNPAGYPSGLELYGALVYVPNAPLEHFPDEVSCGACADEVSGKPLVVATTNAKGEFVLEDVPVGDDIPLVIQLGRWRRVVTIPKIEACTDNVAPPELTRLPRKHKEASPFDNIPRMAMVTGSADALEQMIAKAGIDCSEFTNPNGTGRIHFFRGDQVALFFPFVVEGAGAFIGKASDTPWERTLWDSLNKLKKYDMVLLSCQGGSFTAPDNGRKNLADYAAAGGRVFMTHYSWSWLQNNPYGGFDGTANWYSGNDTTGANNNTGHIDMSHPKGADFADWLLHVHASTTLGQVAIGDARYKVASVNPPAQGWISTTSNKASVQHYSFDTPLSAAEEDRCGRVLFSNFHVTSGSSGNFANTCGELGINPSAQEMVLQFMMFDLASCALPEAPTCTPKTCDDFGFECGPAGDGCGGLMECGTCPSGQTCGGGGPGKCGSGEDCKPRTCEAQGIECGDAGNGCGGKINCGSCTAPQWCGGGGPGKCGGGIK